MTLPQQIGQLQRAAAKLAQSLELIDRVAETHGNPCQADAAKEAAELRLRLSALYTRIHRLEARMPTPELLSQREYDRMLMLGFEIEAAEASRVATYREAFKTQFRQAA